MVEMRASESLINPLTGIIPAMRRWELFLQDQGRSPHTIKAFLGDIALLAAFLPTDKTIGQVTTDDLNRFLAWLQNGRNTPCSPKSLSRRVTSLKAFFRWLASAGRIPSNPAEKVLQQSVISPLPEVLTPDETVRVLEAADLLRTAGRADSRPYALLSLLLETGIKKGECLNLSINHIDLGAPNGPVLFIRYANPSSRYKERKLVLSEDWITAYQAYLAQYNPTDAMFPWSPRRLEYILEDIGKAAGLTKHLSFDMCRWTCALNDWRGGMESEKIRQKLGVSKIQWREIGLKLKQLSEMTPTT
jgi:integrase/recombinase XerD